MKTKQRHGWENGYLEGILGRFERVLEGFSERVLGQVAKNAESMVSELLEGLKLGIFEVHLQCGE